MRWPGVIPPGGRCSMDASHVDVAATLLAAAGVEVENLELEGEDLMPYFAGQRPEPETRDCFSQYNVVRSFSEGWHGIENWRMIFRRPWKFVLHENGERELYNLSSDPHEQLNVADDRDAASIEAQLQADLLAWCRRTGDGFRRT